MSATDLDRRTHWEDVYASKHPSEVSWFQPEPEVSLKLIQRTRISHDGAIIDIGGGASTLTDHLLRADFNDLAVLDIAGSALDHGKRRLGPDADRVDWIISDITTWRPTRAFDLWHDRAVLHFLTGPDEQRAYAEVLTAAVRPGGWAIIGGFAPDGPAQCSGLNVAHHDATSLGALFGDAFALLETHGEVHITPQGRDQKFRYHLFARK